jgi:hypothetical protein
MSLTKAQQKMYKKAKEMKAGGSKKATTPEARAKLVQDQTALKCAICMQTFMCTAKASVLGQHQESKHALLTKLACFPNFNWDDQGTTVASESKRGGESKNRGGRGGAKKAAPPPDDLDALLAEGAAGATKKKKGRRK